MTSPAIVPLPEPAHPCVLFLRRIWALLLRHTYLQIESWPRLVEMLYWPMINILIWGFTSLSILRAFNHPVAMSGIFVAGVLLNEVFFRATIGMLLLFMEELWSRNLGHMFASPLAFFDYILGIMGLSVVRTVLSISLAIAVAAWLFNFSLLSLGLPVVAYFALLIASGWWFGMLLIAFLLRFGLASEWTAWMFTWLFVPLVAPYYPVAVLPVWLQPVSWALPPTYVFESMKSLVAGGPLHGDYLLISLGLNTVYFVAAAIILDRAWKGARVRGGLLQVGE